MGKDKARLRLGRLTLLGHVRARAQELGLSIRVIRRDLIPHRGPLGGVYSALKSCRHDAELFLSCDMPFVPVPLLKRILAEHRKTGRPVFGISSGVFGFPFVIPKKAIGIVEQQLSTGDLSIQKLARKLGARGLSSRDRKALVNINTPADFERALEYYRSLASPTR